MRVDACDFPQAAYSETPLRDPLAPEHQRLTLAVQERRAFFLTGAGTSAPPPTSLPGGAELAARILERLARSGITPSAPIAEPSDLGQVCEALNVQIGWNALVQLLKSAADWDKAPFNLCHLVIAMLFAEGLLIRSFTLNWDDKVRQAASNIAMSPLDSPCDLGTLATSAPPLFVQMHGALDHPATLVATREQVDAPQAMGWTTPLLQAALLEGELVLAGFGAEPEYIVETVVKIRELMDRPALALISDRELESFVEQAPRLAEATGIVDQPDRYIEGDASEILGEVLRSLYQGTARSVIERARQAAVPLAHNTLLPTDEADQLIADLLLGRPLRSLIRLLWRAVALWEEDPARALIPVMGRALEEIIQVVTGLFLVASCRDVSDLTAHQDGVRVRLEDESHFDLWPVMPREQSHAGAVLSTAILNSARFSHSGDAATPLVVLLSHTMGSVPVAGHFSLIAEPRRGSLVEATRAPADALDLGELERRIVDLGRRDDLPLIRDILRLGE